MTTSAPAHCPASHPAALLPQLVVVSPHHHRYPCWDHMRCCCWLLWRASVPYHTYLAWYGLTEELPLLLLLLLLLHCPPSEHLATSAAAHVDLLLALIDAAVADAGPEALDQSLRGWDMVSWPAQPSGKS